MESNKTNAPIIVGAGLSNEKYQLTNKKKKTVFGEILYQIQAVRDFTRADGVKIKRGELGGFIQGIHNLSQKGLCWVDETSAVMRSAKITGDTLVFDESLISDNAVLSEKSVSKNSKIFGKAVVSGQSQILNSTVADNAIVQGKCEILNSNIGDDAIISGSDIKIHSSIVMDKAQIKDRASLFDNIAVMNNATICGDSVLDGYIAVMGNVYIKSGIFNFKEFLVRSTFMPSQTQKVTLDTQTLQEYLDTQKAVKILLTQGLKAQISVSCDGIYHFEVSVSLKNGYSFKVDKGSVANLAKMS